MTQEQFKWALLGVAGLLALKYVIFGLDNWNSMLHASRVEGPEVQIFRQPFLGVFQ